MQNIKKDDKLYTRAFREIRTYIIENNLKPGDLLPTEQSLCETLGISRNVLREAVKSMELMGMVKACPGKGTAVQEFSLDFIFQNVLFFSIGDSEEKSIHEMLDMRRTLELAYMPQAFYALQEADIRRLRECSDLIRERWSRQEYFSDVDREFHMTLFRPLNNNALLSFLQAIWAVDDGFDMEKKRQHLNNTIAKHEAIVTALERHDYSDFITAMQAHFASGKYMSGGNNYEEY